MMMNKIVNCPRNVSLRCICQVCGDGIVDGDDVVEIDKDRYHLSCLEDMTTKELLTWLDYPVYEEGDE